MNCKTLYLEDLKVEKHVHWNETENTQNILKQGTLKHDLIPRDGAT